MHGPLKVVEDSKVCSQFTYLYQMKSKLFTYGAYTQAIEGNADFAENTLPPGLVVKPSQIDGAGSGVWASEVMSKGVRLGPYRGEFVSQFDDAHVSGYSWQVRYVPQYDVKHVLKICVIVGIWSKR